MAKWTLPLLLTLAVIPCITSNGKFYVGFLSYTNKDNLNMSGQCCDGVKNANGHCDVTCDLVFQVSVYGLDGVNMTNKRPSRRPINDTNSFLFSDEYKHAVNPITFDFKKWPGRVQLVVQVFDQDHDQKSSNNTLEDVDRMDYIVSLDQSNTHFIYQNITGIRSVSPSVIRLLFRYECGPTYYGNDCMTDCLMYPANTLCPRTTTILALTSPSTRQSMTSPSTRHSMTSQSSEPATPLTDCLTSSTTETASTEHITTSTPETSASSSSAATTSPTSYEVVTSGISLQPFTDSSVLSTADVSASTSYGQTTGMVGVSTASTHLGASSTVSGDLTEITSSKSPKYATSTSTVSVGPTGITSTKPLGSATSTPSASVSLTGITSTKSLAYPTSTPSASVSPTGITSTKSQGYPTSTPLVSGSLIDITSTKSQKETPSLVPATTIPSQASTRTSTFVDVQQTTPGTTLLPQNSHVQTSTKPGHHPTTSDLPVKSTRDPKDFALQGKSDNNLAIILGCVLGALVLIAIVLFLVYQNRQKRIRKRQEIYNVSPEVISIVEENGATERSDVPITTSPL